MLADSPPPPSQQQSRLILLGAARFPGLPTLGDSQAAPLGRSAELVHQYFTARMGVRGALNLFDQPMSASEQVKQIKEYLLASPDGSRVFIYYIGHGILISGAGGASEYVLACRDTSHHAKLGTSITVAAIGELLKSVAARLDVVIILDCCFAAMAFSSLQVGCRSLSLLAASSRYKAAIASPTATRTQFTDCVYQALEAGSPERGERLSLSEIEVLVREKMRQNYPDTGVDPEVHAPKYGLGDPRHDPIFPNPAFQRSAAAAAPAAPSSGAYLIVQVEPEKRRSARPRYHVKAWMLIEPAQDHYWGDLIWDTDSGNDGKPVPQAQLAPLLLALHRGAADWLLARDVYSPEFWIELVVPIELLDEGFDQLAGVNGPLGADHHLVIRSWERLRIAQSAAAMGPGKIKISLKPEAACAPGEGSALTADAILRQQQRWEQLHRSAPPGSAACLELPPAAIADRGSDRARRAWVRAHCPSGRPLWDPLVSPQGMAVVCAVMEASPAAGSAQRDSFITLLRAGIPIILWARRPASPDSAALLSMINTPDVRHIPDRIRALRREAAADPSGSHDGRGLTLLWDNPNRLPARIRLRAPETRR